LIFSFRWRYFDALIRCHDAFADTPRRHTRHMLMPRHAAIYFVTLLIIYATLSLPLRYAAFFFRRYATPCLYAS